MQYPAGAWRRVQRAAAGRSRQFRAWLAEQRAEDLESTWTAVEEALAGLTDRLAQDLSDRVEAGLDEKSPVDFKAFSAVADAAEAAASTAAKQAWQAEKVLPAGGVPPELQRSVF